jgi:flagellar hook-basal body complex protein FliE
MPKSKLRKNHKQKVQAWKQKNDNITKSFNKQLREAIAKTNSTQSEGQVQLKVKE